MRPLLTLLLLVAGSFICAAQSEKKAETAKPAPKEVPAAQSLGAVRPSNLVLPQIAVSSFGGPAGPAFGGIVTNDLTLADIATKPGNESATAAAVAQDVKSGTVSYDAWTAAGVNYVLRGQIDGGSASAELYDIVSRQRVFGNQYSGFTSANAGAHRVADDIIKAMANMPGIFASQICCLADKAGGTKEVLVLDPDGGNIRQVTNERALVSSPCWGKNSTEIYFTSYRDNNPDLYGITLGGNVFDISRRPGLNTAVAWCPATERIAASLSKDGNSEIYTMNRTGKELARLTSSPDADTAPAWSPDGGQIAFTSDSQGRPGIYVMSAGGGDARPIASGGYFDSPSWSPDGAKLAYVAREGSEFNIYMANLNGGPAVQLTRGTRDNTDPSWGPSSRHIIFCSNRNGSKELYMLNIDTKRAHQITKGQNCSAPCWSPSSGK